MVRCKAEWEHQETLWISWPHNKNNWGARLDSLRKMYHQLIKTVLEFQNVDVLVTSEEELRGLKAEYSNKEFLYEVTFHHMKTDDIWIRDYGPLYLESAEGVTGISFEFNAWGGKFPPWDCDNAIATKILQCKNYRKIESKLILEGGNLECDGEGTLLTVDECFYASGRNEGVSHEAVERWFLENAGIQKMLWLPYGLRCDHTDGHIDNIARLIGDNRILLYMPKEGDSEYERMMVNYNYLKQNSDYDIVLCPFMELLELEGEVLPAGYCNFVIVNGAVIVPAYEKSPPERIQAFFEQIFVERKVKFIDISTLIEEGGGLHCMTKNE